MFIKFFNPGLGYRNLKDELDAEYFRVMTAGDLILRADVEKLEKSIAEYCGTKYAIGVNSCTDALQLALEAVGVGPGDEVLVPSRTFVATPQVIVRVGATPVYYDLDGEMTVTSKTKAIMPVHIEGHFDNNFEKILELAKKHNLYVIEDAAQALGAEYKDKKAGAWGTAGAFSFYPAKTLGSYGDAGMLVTNDDKVYEYVKGCRNHFSVSTISGEKEKTPGWGVNSRLDNLQAAFLNVKFRHYGETLARRKEIAEMYRDNLVGPILPPHTEGRIWQDYIIRTDRRDELHFYLKEKGIETLRNNYPFPVPKLPQAQKYEDETLRLPCNENLTRDEVFEIIKTINEFYTQ